MKVRDIDEIEDTTEFGSEGDAPTIAIYIKDKPDIPNSCVTDGFDSELGDYEFLYGLINRDTEKERIETMQIINYPEAIKTGFKDVPDLGLLNYDGYGFNFKNATIKEILTELFIDNYEKFKKAYEEYAEIMGF